MTVIVPTRFHPRAQPALPVPEACILRSRRRHMPSCRLLPPPSRPHLQCLQRQLLFLRNLRWCRWLSSRCSGITIQRRSSFRHRCLNSSQRSQRRFSPFPRAASLDMCDNLISQNVFIDQFEKVKSSTKSSTYCTMTNSDVKLTIVWGSCLSETD